MTPSWRKPAGMLAILSLIVLWCALVVSMSSAIAQWHWAFQLGFYVFAGIVWIMPLKPLLRWMETGRWR